MTRENPPITKRLTLLECYERTVAMSEALGKKGVRLCSAMLKVLNPQRLNAMAHIFSENSHVNTHFLLTLIRYDYHLHFPKMAFFRSRHQRHLASMHQENG